MNELLREYMRLARRVFPKNSFERKDATRFVVQIAKFLRSGNIKHLFNLRPPIPYDYWALAEERQEYYDMLCNIFDELPKRQLEWMLRKRKCYSCGAENVCVALVYPTARAVPSVFCWRCVSKMLKAVEEK